MSPKGPVNTERRSRGNPDPAYQDWGWSSMDIMVTHDAMAGID
jgi:hypothetical protein